MAEGNSVKRGPGARYLSLLLPLPRRTPGVGLFTWLVLSLAAAGIASAALPFHDPFNDATAVGGSAYTPGAPLAAQARDGNAWVSIGSNNLTDVEPVIVEERLVYPGLPGGEGNSVSFAGSAGKSARLNLNAAVTAGRAYYSFLLKISDLSTVPSEPSDNYIACFSDNPAPQANLLARAGAKLVTRRSGAGFVLGIGKSVTPSDFVYGTDVYSENDVLFVVASYEWTADGTVARLWVNPPAASFGNAAPPPPAIACQTGTQRDLNAAGVRAFVLSCQNPNAPSGLVADLRIGTSWSQVTGQPADGRPNIVFILCDDLGYGDVGILFQNGRAPGQPRLRTPELDTLAENGIQLRRHYCPAPICAPSRASLLLGVHQGHANVRDRQWRTEIEDNHTIATMLKEAGYATAAIGKWGLPGEGTGPHDWPSYPTRRGFDYFFGYAYHAEGHEHYPKEGPYRGEKDLWDGAANITAGLDKCYTTDLFTARAKKWIVDHKAAGSGQPFFLYLAFDTPHSVYELPTQAYPPGGGMHGGLQWTGTPGAMINTASGTIDSFVHPEFAEKDWPEVFKRFATSVRRIDEAVADLQQLLVDLGIHENTLVVFTSDNGPTNEDALGLPVPYATNFFDGFGPFDGIKGDVLEGGIRVPAFAWWPGRIPAGAISEFPSQFHDWMPTFAALAGVPAPARADGVSLLPTLFGEGSQREGEVYVEFSTPNRTPNFAEFEDGRRRRMRGQMQTILLDGYQGIRYDVSSHADDFEIYDVASDPKQTVNLASNPAFGELQQRMKDRVLRIRRPDPGAPRPWDDEATPAAPAGWSAPGVVWRAAAGAFPWTSLLDGLTPDQTGVAERPGPEVFAEETHAAILFEGRFSVPVEGDYTFYLRADSGALLRIHEATVIDADFGYVSGSEVSGSIRLEAGPHPFRLHYTRGSLGTPELELQWSGPGFAKQPVPESAFRREAPVPKVMLGRNGETIFVNWDGDGILQSAPAAAGPYTDIPGATSPHPVAAGAADRLFFRLRMEGLGD